MHERTYILSLLPYVCIDNDRKNDTFLNFVFRLTFRWVGDLQYDINAVSQIEHFLLPRSPQTHLKMRSFSTQPNLTAVIGTYGTRDPMKYEYSVVSVERDRSIYATHNFRYFSLSTRIDSVLLQQ
jgi:hypothetical protein